MFRFLRDWFPQKSLGKRAENHAARFLKSHGYRILIRNYSNRFGEIDLIAQQADVLVFVEVRSRSGTAYGHPVETVDREKQLKISRTAQAYLKARNLLDKPARFEVVTLVYDENQKKFELNHYSPAFELQL